MNRSNKIIRTIAIVLFSALGLSACDQADEVFANEFVSIIDLGEEGETSVDINALKIMTTLGDGELSEVQIEWLKFMREEEKLAGDVYRTLYQLFNIPVFNNISKAEDNHTSIVLTYLEAWGIDDPASDEVGVFANEELQMLYDELVLKGTVDLTEALKVGALIEEVDIKDLADLYEMEPTEDLTLLAEALMLGSRNHLRAFTRILERRGVDYEPVVLSVEEYEAIVNSPWERGTGLCRTIGSQEAL